MTLDELFAKLRSDRTIWFGRTGGQGKSPYSKKFLNAVAEIFECRGLEQARLYALSKLQTRESGAARGILKVLDHIADCPTAKDDAPVGRTVIKSLYAFKPDQ